MAVKWETATVAELQRAGVLLVEDVDSAIAQSTPGKAAGVFIFGHGFPRSGQAGSQAESSGFHQHLVDVLVARLQNPDTSAYSRPAPLSPRHA